MIYTIYRIDCAPTRKGYVGLTSQKPNARWGQHKSAARSKKNGSLLCRAIRKYGEHNFRLSVLSEHETFDAAILEERSAIKAYGTLVPGGYNLTVGGDGITGSARSALTRRRIGRRSANRGPEVREKIAAALRGRKMVFTPEGRAAKSDAARAFRHTTTSRAKISAARVGKPNPPLSPERDAAKRAKLSAKMKGRVYSAEHRRRISEARKGMKFSAEHRANIGRSGIGRVRTPELRERQRKAILGRRNTSESIERMRAAAQARASNQRGKAHSSEHRARISAALKLAYAEGRRHPRGTRLPSPAIDTPPEPRG